MIPMKSKVHIKVFLLFSLLWTIAVLFIGLLGAPFYFISENDKLQEESLRKEAELQETK